MTSPQQKSFKTYLREAGIHTRLPEHIVQTYYDKYIDILRRAEAKDTEEQIRDSILQDMNEMTPQMRTLFHLLELTSDALTEIVYTQKNRSQLP